MMEIEFKSQRVFRLRKIDGTRAVWSFFTVNGRLMRITSRYREQMLQEHPEVVRQF